MMMQTALQKCIQKLRWVGGPVAAKYTSPEVKKRFKHYIKFFSLLSKLMLLNKPDSGLSKAGFKQVAKLKDAFRMIFNL